MGLCLDGDLLIFLGLRSDGDLLLFLGLCSDLMTSISEIGGGVGESVDEGEGPGVMDLVCEVGGD